MQIPDYSGGDAFNPAASEASEAANLSSQAKHFQDQLDRVLQKKRESDAAKARSNAKISSYLNKMPDGVDTFKVPVSDKPALTDWAKNMQINFGKYAEEAAIAEEQGDYQRLVMAKTEMDRIETAFQNVNNNLDNFKNYKDNFLKDAEDGMISNAVNSSKRELLASVYTDEMNMSFDYNGNVVFQNEEGFLNINDIPDYTVKNNTGATEILQMNEEIFQAGMPMSDSNKRLARMKLQNATKSRDEVLSLATDDFITEGGLGILDEDLLYNPERIDELRGKVIDSYMTMLGESADAGYKRKQKVSEEQADDDVPSEISNWIENNKNNNLTQEDWMQNVFAGSKYYLEPAYADADSDEIKGYYIVDSRRRSQEGMIYVKDLTSATLSPIVKKLKL
jgi:hypothetical protein